MGYSRAALCRLVISFTSLSVVAQEQAVVPARELVRWMVENELSACHDDHTLWHYYSRIYKDAKVFDVETVQTREGEVHRQLAIDGRPLTEEEVAREQGYINSLLTDAGSRSKHYRKQQEDAEEAAKLFRLFPVAFNYEYAGKNGHHLRLKFTPDPSFDPPDREAKVFQAMSGEMWIDARQRRLVKIYGALSEDVKFGFGLLGHLKKGGTFMVEQTEPAPGHWQLKLLDVNMAGKALLFKSISVKQREEHSGFTRVPDGLELAEGIQLLRDTSMARAASGQTGSK